MRLASYTFRLPAGYQLTAAASPPCHAFAVIALPAPWCHLTARSPSTLPTAGR